jgi:hypothetical protein
MMLSALFTTTFLFAIFALRARADIFVATIPVTQCKPATLTWDGTANGPFDVVLVSPSDPCGDILYDFGIVNSGSYTWDTVNATAGLSLMVSVLDNDGNEGWSGNITVQPSDDSSCLTPQNTTPSQSPYSPDYSNPSPSPTTPTPSSKPPAATVVGASNNGVMDSGASTVHLSGMALGFTAFCALVALL